LRWLEPELMRLLVGSSAFSHMGLVFNEAYKSRFLNQGKGTDPTKQAALTCAAICAVNPLRPVPTDEVHEEHIYVNQMLAMRCACSIINHPVYLRSFDEQRRIYLQMQRFVFPSADVILDEAIENSGDIKSNVYQSHLLPPRNLR
jgi:hypothetical protein